MSLPDISSFPSAGSVLSYGLEQNGGPPMEEASSYTVESKEYHLGIRSPPNIGCRNAVENVESSPSDQHIATTLSNDSKSSHLAESKNISHSESDKSEIQAGSADLSQGRGPEEYFGDALAINKSGEEHPSNLEDTASIDEAKKAVLQATNHLADSSSPETTVLPSSLSGDKYNADHDDALRGEEEEVREDRGGNESHDLDEASSQSEIQSIIDQFENKGYEIKDQPDSDTEVSSLRPSFLPPPRKSSLEPIQPSSQNIKLSHSEEHSSPLPSKAHDVGSLQGTSDLEKSEASFKRNSTISLHTKFGTPDQNRQTSPRSSISLQKALPPAPDPEPDLPFDFHRFLEQLRHRTADPVAKFLRSFLNEFGKKQWMVHEQVKIISDFLTFITNKMAQCEVWRDVSDAEFDNAKEGMEKLVMNRLYTQTFSPAIPPPISIPIVKGKRKAVDNVSGLGRRGQHQEDIERDDVLAQKVRIYGWVKEEHLDIATVGESGRRFLSLAQQGLIHKIITRLQILISSRAS